MTPWTSVVSYHTDPESCGVARFSAQLAQRLGVPHAPLLDTMAWGDNPLLSLKWRELEGVPVRACLPHDQLWHDEAPLNYPVTGRVWKLYELGVPSLVEPMTLSGRALFTFGMAHKIELRRFIELREVLPDYQLWISTAAHEGAGPSKVKELVLAWGNARNLGHLTDAALQLVWPRVRACVAFFEHGLRANNSSVHAALDAGVTVITNHGPQTPDDLKRVTMDYRDLGKVYWRKPTASPYTWDRLLKELEYDPKP